MCFVKCFPFHPSHICAQCKSITFHAMHIHMHACKCVFVGELGPCDCCGTTMSVKSLHPPSLHLSCTTAFSSSAAVRASAACREDKTTVRVGMQKQHRTRDTCYSVLSIFLLPQCYIRMNVIRQCDSMCVGRHLEEGPGYL